MVEATGRGFLSSASKESIFVEFLRKVTKKQK